MKIHLIRHGETNWNAERRCQGQSESELTNRGEEQARNVRALIGSLGVGRVFVSSSLRTRQTARLCVGDLNLPTEYRDDLREIRLGPWEGRLWSELQEEQPDLVNTFENRPHLFELNGAESFVELQQRGVSAIEQLVANHDEENLLVVSHGAIIKSILVHYADIALSRVWDPPELDNCSHSVLLCSGEQHEIEVAQIGGTPREHTDW